MSKEKPEGWALERISRRKALKRVAAGTAVAWSAPILTSLSTPASARHLYSECAGHELVDCDPTTVQECNGPPCPTFGPCACVATTEGGSACINNWICDSRGTCNSSADCPNAGDVCVPGSGSCCGTNQCAPPCGTCPVAPTSGATAGLPA
jgi:hypothetical protein